MSTITDQLAELVNVARANMRDIANGWPMRELAMPPTEFEQKAAECLARYDTQKATADGQPVRLDGERIIVLSDGGSWETFDPASVRILDITPDAFEDLCEGSEPGDLADDQILADRKISEVLQAAPDVLRVAIERAEFEGAPHP